MIPPNSPLPLGTKTRWGSIVAVGLTGGERYYWMEDQHGTTAMMPADIVESKTTAK